MKRRIGILLFCEVFNDFIVNKALKSGKQKIIDKQTNKE